MPKTIFLDIDGTLLRTKGAGLRAIGAVMNRHFGVTELPQVNVQGRTDMGIWKEIFLKIGIELPPKIEFLIEEYCDCLRQNLVDSPGILLPGVKPLLHSLSQSDDFRVGLLTGNAKQAANIKMELFGLSDYVETFGGFGDKYEFRNDVAKSACDSAKGYLGEEFSPHQTWVVGDTINDISCARCINAHVLAVATGGTSMDELRSANPDALVKNFENTSEILSTFGKPI